MIYGKQQEKLSKKCGKTIITKRIDKDTETLRLASERQRTELDSPNYFDSFFVCNYWKW